LGPFAGSRRIVPQVVAQARAGIRHHRAQFPAVKRPPVLPDTFMPEKARTAIQPYGAPQRPDKRGGNRRERQHTDNIKRAFSVGKIARRPHTRWIALHKSGNIENLVFHLVTLFFTPLSISRVAVKKSSTPRA